MDRIFLNFSRVSNMKKGDIINDNGKLIKIVKRTNCNKCFYCDKSCPTVTFISRGTLYADKFCDLSGLSFKKVGEAKEINEFYERNKGGMT